MLPESYGRGGEENDEERSEKVSARTEDGDGVDVGEAPAGGLGVEGVEEDEALPFLLSARLGDDHGDGALTASFPDFPPLANRNREEKQGGRKEWRWRSEGGGTG